MGTKYIAVMVYYSPLLGGYVFGVAPLSLSLSVAGLFTSTTHFRESLETPSPHTYAHARSRKQKALAI